MASLTVKDYHVGWICALSKEMTAAKVMLDVIHGRAESVRAGDSNAYEYGRIHDHNVVIAVLPKGVDGTTAAAIVAKDMARSFPALRMMLMVGIGGGIPNLPKIDIRLGDIVVGTPEGTWGGVVQYDKGKAEDGGIFVPKGQLSQPPNLLLNAIAALAASHDMTDSLVSTYLKQAQEKHPKIVERGTPSLISQIYCTAANAT